MMTTDQIAALIALGTTEAPAKGATVFLLRKGVLLQGTVHADGAIVTADGATKLEDGETYLTAEWASAKPLAAIKVIGTGIRHCATHGEWRVWDAEGKRARCASCKDGKLDKAKTKREEAKAKRTAAALASLV